MTDNMRKFLEAASQDTEFLEKFSKAESQEAIVALAAEKGFALTEEDLKQEQPVSGDVSDDELDAVAGGQTCACVLGGGGKASGSSKTCACFMGGVGNIELPWVTKDGMHFTSEYLRCVCPGAGGGEDHAISPPD